MGLFAGDGVLRTPFNAPIPVPGEDGNGGAGGGSRENAMGTGPSALARSKPHLPYIVVRRICPLGPNRVPAAATAAWCRTWIDEPPATRGDAVVAAAGLCRATRGGAGAGWCWCWCWRAYIGTEGVCDDFGALGCGRNILERFPDALLPALGRCAARNSGVPRTGKDGEGGGRGNALRGDRGGSFLLVVGVVAVVDMDVDVGGGGGSGGEDDEGGIRRMTSEFKCTCACVVSCSVDSDAESSPLEPPPP
jgi:hypothetical protein